MSIARWRLTVRGSVQGVGFRPAVYRLATDLGLSGWVANVGDGVVVEAEGDSECLDGFLRSLRAIPWPAAVDSLSHRLLPVQGDGGFFVQKSRAAAAGSPTPPRDYAPCDDCRKELFDPCDRRYLYPFITCAVCGPRFTILKSLPFDRASTTMSAFVPCQVCAKEYDSPVNRRFHAETISCPACGPRLSFLDSSQEERAEGADAVAAAASVLRSGGIVALKGVGGYQLLAHGAADAAVSRLREGKARPGKPLALLFRHASEVEAFCELSVDEKRLLTSPEAPIVLLRRRPLAGTAICTGVAPTSPFYGAMLPASPLHAVLMHHVGLPLVATSANRGGEPIYIDELTALERLRHLADAWLVHDRAIVHRADDPVVRMRGGRVRVLRLGRGYAPLAIPHQRDDSPAVLACGGIEKNTFALTTPTHIVVSQHVGDLTSPQAWAALATECRAYSQLLGRRPTLQVSDAHPDAPSHGLAQVLAAPTPIARVQHHHGHALACMAEHGLTGPVLAIAWDGTGYGAGDAPIWGGEFLRVHGTKAARLGHLRTFQLPGGERAVREPRRSALGLLYEIFGNDALAIHPRLQRAFTAPEGRVLLTALSAGVNCPRTSSIGRLFDGLASLIGVCQKSQYSEQSPTALEALALSAEAATSYKLRIARSSRDEPVVIDWEEMLRNILLDIAAAKPREDIALGFHLALSEACLATALLFDLRVVVLTGGVFQNACLAQHAEERLTSAGFTVYTHQLVPAGDGGLAAGQAYYGLLRGAAVNDHERGDACV